MTMNLAFMSLWENPKYRFASRENQILVFSSVDQNNFFKPFQPGFSIKFKLCLGNSFHFSPHFQPTKMRSKYSLKKVNTVDKTNFLKTLSYTVF